MSRQGLPAQAANVLRHVEEGDTCDSSVVESLKLLLLPSAHAIQKESAVRNLPRSKGAKPAASQLKGSTTRGKRQPALDVLDCGKVESHDVLEPQEKLILATEIVNVTLKALTTAIKTARKPQTPSSSSEALGISTSPTIVKANVGAPTQVQTPLRQICVNRVLQSPAKNKEVIRSSHASFKDSNCVRAQAECSRIGLACLRSLHSDETSFNTRFAPLQLENGMSALIAKLLSLGYEDLAASELRILRRRIEALTSDLNAVPSKTPYGARKKFPKDDTNFQKETLPDLLKYSTSHVSGPLLDLILTSQVQVLKILAVKGHGPSIEAAAEHLRIDSDFAPSKLVERGINTMDNKTMINAAHQLETLAQTVMRLCPSASRARDEHLNTRPHPSAQATLELQSLALQIRIRWWTLSDHQPDINMEVLTPFARYLAAFERRCTLEGNDKYCIAKKTFIDVSKSLGSRVDRLQFASLAVFKILANQADAAGRNNEATEWIEKGLQATDSLEDSRLQRCAFLCRLATCHLRKRGCQSDDSQTMKNLRNALTGIEGDLSGESSDLDELLLAVADLKKNAFTLVHNDAKNFVPSQIPHESSLLGQCVQAILISIRFLVRYAGRKPASGATESELLRYSQRTQMAKRMLPSMIASVLAVSKLYLNTSFEDWQRFEAALQDADELSTRLGFTSESPHVSISSVYWLRFASQKKLSTDANVYMDSIKNSVNVLENRPDDEKIQGSFLMKVEKYASVCENLQEYGASRDYYRKAVIFLIEIGSFKVFAEHARSMAWPSAVARNSEFEQISRILAALPKVMLKFNSSASESRIYFDPDWLPKDQRGLTLQIQLNSLISLLLDRGSSHSMWEELQNLYTLLLSLYVDDNFFEQRLNVHIQLLHLFAILPMTLENSSFSKMLEQAEVELQQFPGVCAGSTRPHIRHLASRINLYQNLKDCSNVSILEPIVVDWLNLVQRCPNRELLERQVYDISGWLQQLDLMAEHLHVSGDESLRTAVLNLIVVIHEGASPRECIDLASSLTNLGIHYGRIGYPGHCSVVFGKAGRIIDVADVPSKLMLQWYLANAEHGLLSCDIEKCAAFIEQGTDTLQILRQSSQCSPNDRVSFAQAAADLMFIQSGLLFEQRQPEKALFFARAAVQEYQRTWASLNRRMGPVEGKSPVVNVDENLVTALSELSVVENPVKSDITSKYATLRILKSWYLSPRLFAGILNLSQCFAHDGLLLEAQYYLEQCQKIADAVKSPSMTRTCLALRGEYAICSSEVEQGLAMLRNVESALSRLPSTYGNVTLNARVALHYIKAKEMHAGSAAGNESIRRLRSLAVTSANDRLLCNSSQNERMDSQMAGLGLEIVKKAPPKKTRVARSKSTKTPPVQARERLSPEDEELFSTNLIPSTWLESQVLCHLSVAELGRGSLNSAMTLLDQSSTLSQRQGDLIMQELLRSQVHLGQTFQRLRVDPVFSVLPESTICSPAVITAKEAETLPNSSSKKYISGKTGRSKTLNTKVLQKENSLPQDCLELLPLARKCLTEVSGIAKRISSTSTLHTISETLGKILIMLSVIPSSAIKTFSSSQFMLYAIELGRKIAMDRESSSIKVERLLSGHRGPGVLPDLEECGERMRSQHAHFDFSTFQEDYLDIIPNSWTVLSISLSQSNEEMWISRIRAGQSPFILRLPFNRENASELDEEGLTFTEGKAEMVDIVELANTSAHSAADLSQKGAKKEWWDTRATLDTRLKDLLTNMENIWLGGFRGIFSSEIPESCLLARFEQSLQNILSKHLPSRRTSAKTKQIDQIRLDSRILELFVGLGPPTDENDVDEQLMDLLYFVVDILQFHKERNAYDEIDFDAIVVETVDALRQYHQAKESGQLTSGKQHTILILDRNLHCFPWESLPCMTGQSVSRLPSLGCLRRRILQMRDEQDGGWNKAFLEGIRVDPGRGTYILNPAGDLANTQASFENSLRELSNWDSFVEREPSEAEMKSCLHDNKIFLYFGHGSGGQYIRSRTIKKLDQCAVALLMGCSSGTLTQAGEYEAYGTPVSYMHAGCPALLATLWDVTDKDIDRFSDKVLREWGLFREKAPAPTSSPVKKSVRAKGKMKAKVEEVVTESAQTPLSLDEAVARSRDACILKYLNGAAPVVYGIPVYLG